MLRSVNTSTGLPEYKGIRSERNMIWISEITANLNKPYVKELSSYRKLKYSNSYIFAT